MKNLFLSLVLAMSTLVSFGQNIKRDTTLVRDVKLEKLVFKYINDYRLSLGRSSLVWDDNVHKVASFHSRYLSSREIPSISHYEDIDRSNFNEILKFSDRLKFFKINYKDAIENVCSGMTFGLETDADYQKLAKSIVNKWILSPSHNEAMLLYNMKVGAVGIFLQENTYVSPVLVLCELKD